MAADVVFGGEVEYAVDVGQRPNPDISGAKETKARAQDAKKRMWAATAAMIGMGRFIDAHSGPETSYGSGDE